MTEHAHEERHHQLIDERVKAFLSAPRRTQLDRIRRRELLKKAAWTLTGHLRCCHGWRGNSALLSVEDLEKIHRKLDV